MPSHRAPETSHRSGPRGLLPGGLACLLLIVLAAVAYARVGTCGFVFDDITYVVQNPHVQEGLGGPALRWAWSSGYAANWHPLTWMSHMLDYRLYGLEPAGHHLTNLVLHVLTTLLLFGVLERMTAALWRSAFVAALFALHPSHVESVAWVAERKDVLSALFWVLTMGCYARYVSRPGAARYLLTLLVFALGLTAKQMLVTLPFVLLLLDVWPLGRLSGFGVPAAGDERSQAAWRGQVTPIARLVLEKVPLLVLAGAASVATLIAQRSGGAVIAIEEIPLLARVENALVSSVAYVGKLLWPAGLCAFYPYRSDLPAWQVWLSLGVLVAVSAWALLSLRRRPYVAVGWLWFLGSLVPVIGLVQIGQQAMADRYTYLPSIGLFLLLCWLVPDLLARSRNAARILAGCGVVVVLLLTWRTFVQVGTWKSDVTLFERALAVTEDNHLAENNFGEALVAEGRIEEALVHFRRSVTIRPDYALAHSNLGAAALDLGRIDEALEHNRRAVGLVPDDPLSRINLANSLGAAGRLDEAAESFSEALRLDPSNAQAHVGLGQVRLLQGRAEEADASFRQAVAVDPLNVQAHLKLAVRLAAEGRANDAAGHLETVLRLQPQNPVALASLGTILLGSGRPAEAFGLLARAVELAPQLPDAQVSLAHVLLAQGQLEQASRCFAAAIELTKGRNDEYVGYGTTLPQQARLGLGHTLAAQGLAAEAAREYETAVQMAPQWPPALTGLAWLLATTDDDGLRDADRAATLAAEACRLTGDQDPKALDALAAAYAGQGRFDRAIEKVEVGIQAARAARAERLVQGMLERAEGYRQGRAVRQRALDLSQ